MHSPIIQDVKSSYIEADNSPWMTSLDHKDALLPFPILKRFFEVSRLDFQREVMFFSKPFDKSYRIFIPYLITSPNMSTDTPCKVQQKKI